MVVIFFNLGLVLAFILLVSIVFINASTKFVLAILGVICILFLIKDIIQDLYFALYKYKNNVLIVIISFALDIARIAFFLINLYIILQQEQPGQLDYLRLDGC